MWDALEAEADYFCLTEVKNQVRLRRPIRINVGEFCFTTNRGLLRRGGERLLLFIEDSKVDKDEAIILTSSSRGPKLFGDILFYFRTDRIFFEEEMLDHEHENKGHLELLEAEATYWGVRDLSEIIRNLINRMNNDHQHTPTQTNSNTPIEDENVDVQDDDADEDNILYDEFLDHDIVEDYINSEQEEEDEEEDAMDGHIWNSRGL